MAFNLRKFNSEQEYSAATLNYPAVSWIVSGDTFHYDKTEPTPPEPTYGGLTVKYYIEDASVEVTLFNGGGGSSSSGSGSGGGGALPTTMIVDGNEETPINTWRFETEGEHIVQYGFENNEIPNQYFTDLENITSVIVGDDITSIGEITFSRNLDLTSVTISSGVTNIGAKAFVNCGDLISITVNSVDPPQLGSNAFGNTNNCPIYVPASAVEEYQASTSTGWYEYASRIEAIQ